MAPFKSSLAKSAGKLFGVFRQADLSLRGATQTDRIPPPGPVASSGGTAFNSTPKGTIHRFTTSGSFIINDPTGTNPVIGSCKILVVGGGGAGGSFYPGQYGGGGGGAGGVRFIPSITVPTGSTLPITVGDGGTGGNPYTTPAAGGPAAQPRGGGTNSVFNSPGGNGIPAITATGGGGGGNTGGAGASGGSGGGKSYPGPSVGPGNAGGNDPRANPISEGNPSEAEKSAVGAGSYGSGGGGGAGSGTTAWKTGANGLALVDIGSPGDPWLPPAGNVFAGGGGGTSYKETEGNGPGGPGGGGDAPGGSGVAYTGGGGGARGTNGGNSGSGGKGVVYVIIPAAISCTGSPG